MKVLLAVVVLFALVHYGFSAVAIIPADKTPGHAGFCNSDLTGPLGKGESKQMKDCSSAVCTDSGDIQLVGCGIAKAGSGCKVVEDHKLPHPECCPQIVCD